MTAVKFSLYTNSTLREDWRKYVRNITPSSNIAYNKFCKDVLKDAKRQAPRSKGVGNIAGGGHLEDAIRYEPRGYLKGTFHSIAVNSKGQDYAQIRHAIQAKKYTKKGSKYQYLIDPFTWHSEFLKERLKQIMLGKR